MAKTKESIIEQPAGSVNDGESSQNVDKALSEADREVIEAGNLAEQIAAEEGVKVSVPRERRQIPATEFMRRAQRQREVGLRMLSNRRAGLASVTQKVQINNYLVASTFSRFFPVIDQCLYTLHAQGEYRLGEAVANKLIEQIMSRINEFVQMANSEFNASSVLVAEVSTRNDCVTPGYTESAYEGDIQVKTPEALALLKAFEQFDNVVLNIEILHWNNERMQSDVQDAIQMQKRAIAPLFTICSRTLIQMRNRVQGSR